MGKTNSPLEARIHEVIAAAVSGAIDAFRHEVLAEVSRSLGKPTIASPGAPALSVASRTARGATPRKRAWPTCSVPGCSNKFFGPSGSARFCYEHYVQSGGQHPAKIAAAPAGKSALKAAANGKAASGPSAKGGGGAASELLTFIIRNPGLRSEQIQRQIGLAPAVVKAGLAQLRAESRVATQGNRRATTYSAA